MVNGGIPQLLNMTAHLDKWAADPAHPPSECLFTPSDDCAVEFY